MSKYMKNTTETIIQALTDEGQTIEYSSNGNGKMCMSINGEPSQIISDSFEHLNELFITYFVMERGKRIDGGCTNGWHILPLNEIVENCPSCNEKRYVTDFQKECNSPWHILSAQDRENNCPVCDMGKYYGTEIKCPGCQQEITPKNAGGYRTFCMDCVKLFLDFPKDDRGYTIEVSSIQADAGLKQTIFKWVPNECSDSWHSCKILDECPTCDEKTEWPRNV